MGVVLSRLWTTKPSFREHLEHLETEIKRIESAQQRNAIIKRQLISSIVLWSSVLYIISFISYYLLFFPETWALRVLYAVPFFVAPILIFALNKFVSLYLERRFQKYIVKLRDIKNEKKKVLEDIIETESFKNAKELLERFDPESTFLRPTSAAGAPMMTPARGIGAGTPLLCPDTPVPVTPRHDMELRNRKNRAPPSNLSLDAHTPTKPVAAATPQPRPCSTPPKRTVKPQRKLLKDVTPIPKPAPKVMSSSATQTTPVKSEKLIPTGVANRTPQVQIVREYLLPGHVMNERAGGPPQAQQILPPQRSAMDKVVEFVIGDGPNNRYALICSQCHSHNGMALPEDFDYTTFRCAYCYTVNPARRNTPMSHRNVYKLPNIQVKPPEIVKEISGVTGDATPVTDSGTEPCETPDQTAELLSEESDVSEMEECDVTETDITTVLSDHQQQEDVCETAEMTVS